MPMRHDPLLPGAFSKELWQQASRRLLAKVIEEFAYERVFGVQEENPGHYRVDIGEVAYRFKAKRYVFDNLSVDPTSIAKRHGDADVLLDDPLAFCAEVLPKLGVKPMTVAHFIKELGNTLVADAHIAARATKTGAELAELDDIRMEGETTGHPWVTVSKGRIGLGYSDYLAYAPENRTATEVLWLGVSKDRASFVAEQKLTNERLVREAVGTSRFGAFCAVLAARGGSTETHYMMPVHPWQWDHMIVPHFAADIASGHMVLLGKGDDLYVPQQSVRTLSNISHPEKSTLKLCMTILNTAVYRGIPGKRALTAAPLTTWLDQLLVKDRFLLEECGLVLLGERAGMHYVHPQFSGVEGAPYQFNEMLGCLWRDSLAAHLKPGETGMPLAALLHAGTDGKPVVQALAEKAGMTVSEWMARFFDVVIPPVFHLLAKHGLAFSAHGQNATLILKESRPERLALRDFIDDVIVCDLEFPESASMPDEVRAVLLCLPADFLIHFIQTTLFICVFRYMSVLLDQRSGLSEDAFWALARESVLRYQKRFPDMASRFATFDLFGDEYPRLCLNRVRLFTHGYADDDERPVPDFQGMVDNPLVAFDRRSNAA
ncbi:IucA/IucC family siderophore biosynthesis protein [Sinorhizobium numidicum]|uniref:IucA/IucC family siderophore biosynthesis protein n=1 Tax=Sinorhizobium numidicum TaxID=680248 RepID=A0ABY8CRU5_9HYPH|nr:IucA/IucC family siderophore biosynthesis protein [Sinorhizobium numidicum]WEX75370.1 IucA/IucC family siderophore biosynthesis protein [Sinorhizobium numidicum]WEX81365.1 IucA/IucC family siderophore biosynthesis protein [Sinorhizobium numidicum]